MIFFANAEGTITKVITEPVYQGSAGVARVVLVAPFPNAMVTVAFTLPNGIRTPINLASPNMVQQDLQGVITPSGQKYNAWTYLLPRAITEYAGIVDVQFFVTTGESGQVLATFASTLTIQKGVPTILPNEPTVSIYEQILEYLTAIQTKLTNIIIPVEVLPTEETLIDFNAIYLLNTNGVYNFYVYYTDISAWVQLDKAVVTVAAAEEIKDNSKVYILTVDDGNLTAGVYVINEGAPLRLLSTVDLAQINIKLQQLETLISTKETALKQQIQGVQNTANNAVSTANSANAQSQTAVSVSSQAQETANEAVAVANSANAKSTTAVNTSDEAKRIAQEALNKAGNVTGVLTPKGNVASISDLPAPSAETLGWFYNVNDAFVTTGQFVEGAGISYLAGENVAIVEPTPGVYKYDVFSGLVDLTPLENEIDDLKDQVADLLYKAITITSFTNNVNTVEIGSTVTAVALSWAFSKTPVSVTLDGVAKAVDSTGESLTGLSLTSGKTWTLRATDERDAVATKTTAISFLNGVYYGVAEAPNTYDSAFILGLTKTLRSSKLTSFNVNAGAGQFIYYCIPTRFGTASFKVGGFDGGFSLVDTISFTNSKGYTENYYVYKSDNAGLGATSVTVS